MDPMFRSLTPGGPAGTLPVLAAVAVLAVASACSSSEPSAGSEETAEAPERGEGATGGRIATVLADEIEIRSEPDGGEVVHTLASPNDFGADRVFLVRRTRGDWLEVLLPVRPNGSTGWIEADDVEVTVTAFRVVVDMSEFSFTVTEGEEELRTGPVGIGTSDAPTPPGEYYFTELLRPPDPGGEYGAYAFGLSGHSDTLESFAGGPGQLGVHGTDDESGLGGEVSHGCIRVSDDDITWMAERLPIGTPVEITE
ncbi:MULTISPECIES: L,D-transpeptidase family protein [Nocardiopsis]|uniref:L,D-transpeptidase family protein n=1 Tax=Nocardiopsis TaxID=2013 RepID=UPI002DBE6FF3|nr:L,D-transpeptidase family protein [Nocardiopsis sp. LDBS1602]MEC3893273.1 L,D-transpeptidase family protein [Nocardiopsis sp. LDBS1602]